MPDRLKRSVRTNSLLAIADQILTAGFAFLTSILLARFLGAEGLGQYSFAITIASLVVAVTTFGTQTTIKRKVSQNAGRTQLYIACGLAVRIIISLPLAISSALLFAFILGESFSESTIILLATIHVLILNVQLLLSTVLTALHRNDALLFYNLAFKSFNIVIAAMVLLNNGGLLELFGSLIVLSALFSLIGLRITLQGVPRFRFKLLITFVRRSYRKLIITASPLMISSLGEFLNSHIDKLFVGAILGSFELGNYAVAYNFLFAAVLVPLAMSKVFFPNFINIVEKSGVEKAKEFIRKYIVIYSVFSVVVALIFWFIADFIIINLYGSELAKSVDYSKYLMLMLVVISLNRLFNYCLTALGENVLFLKASLSAAFINVAANIVLIPIFLTYGAIWATFLAESFLLIYSFMLVKRALSKLKNKQLVAQT